MTHQDNLISPTDKVSIFYVVGVAMATPLEGELLKLDPEDNIHSESQ